MPNIIGIGNSQAPINAMLGGLAYQDSVGEINIDKIKARTGDNAVDVFVYDTRKDSDGGAWRHRTQKTSWYNEAVSATRGARKEFPAVAVIVTESAKLTIYDGDDPNLPMWMVFNNTGSDIANVGILGRAQDANKAAEMLNGILFVGNANYFATYIPFISENVIDFIDSYASVTGPVRFNGNIEQRNEGLGKKAIAGNKILPGSVNDVSMTVFPNAPIDASTGLPMPTIAVATDGGFSVIKDNGIVIDKGVSSTTTNEVDWYKGQYLLGTGPEYWALYKDLSEETSGYVSGTADLYSAGNQSSWDKPQPTGKESQVIAVGDLIVGGSTDAYNAHQPGLSLKHPTSNLSNGTSNLLCEIRKNYNTGWQHGDIKGTFLSSTDTTDVNADTLNSAGNFDSTFATSTGWGGHGGSNDWTISGGVASCNGNNTQRFLYPGSYGWTEGTSVVVEVTVTARTSGTLNVSFDTGNAAAGTDMTATGTYKFVGTVSGNQAVYLRSASFQGSVDDVKIYIAEFDRSINNNGLIPYGTITKSVVATGAELTAYSGFTSSNYLFQPHNTDLQFGTGDYSVMLWYKGTSDSTGNREIFANLRGSTNFWVLSKEYTNKFVFDTVTDPNTYKQDVWNHVAGVRRSGIAYLYVNGKLVGSAAANDNITDTSDGLIIGQNPDNSDWRTRGFLALLRISASTPSEDQVKKIYDDEKCLFQKNAKATLYGTSDQIKGLGFDDTNNVLHVGTSSGRSEFQGLNRINNTTTAVTTAISASNDLVAEQ